MPRLISAPFFDTHPVFRRAEYATAVGRNSDDKVVTAMLTQHLGSGNIKRVGRGVYASVPVFASAQRWPVNLYLGASRLREDGIIGYHSALEMHGYGYSVWQSEVQVISGGHPMVYETSDFTCQFVRPRPAVVRHRAEADGVMTMDLMGLEVKVTTVERTIADVFDRPDLAGGYAELFDSLELVSSIDAKALVRHVKVRGNATAAGALGFWLEREQEWLGGVPAQALQELHALSPPSPRYALGARGVDSRSIGFWNVILPTEVVERRFEGW